jgi:hypothetical protein
MASATEFRLLGPVEVRRAGLVIPVQPGKQRTVLAALLLKGDRVVPLEELGEVSEAIGYGYERDARGTPPAGGSASRG